MKLIVSTTAESHGYGSMPYKWCSGLTRSEKQAVKAGEIVVYEDDRLSNGNNGHYLRRVLHNPGRGYTRTVASNAEVAEYERMTGQRVRYIPMTPAERERAGKTRKIENQKRAAAQASRNKEFFLSIHNSPALTPNEAVQRALIPESKLSTFGIDAEERAELVNEPSLRVFHGRAVIYQAAIERSGCYPRLIAAEHRGSLFTTGYWEL